MPIYDDLLNHRLVGLLWALLNRAYGISSAVTCHDVSIQGEGKTYSAVAVDTVPTTS